MVAGRCRFHSGCGSRRIGSSTEPTTRRTAPWFASRLRLASFVSCVRPRVNSCRCGLISFASPSATIFKALLGRGRCNDFTSSHGTSRHAVPAWRRRIRAPVPRSLTPCLGGVVSGESFWLQVQATRRNGSMPRARTYHPEWRSTLEEHFQRMLAAYPQA